MPPPSRPPVAPAPGRNPWLVPLRREIQRQRSGFMGGQVTPFLDAFELHVCEQDRRIGALEELARALVEHNHGLNARVLDLERQAADQADLLQRQAERINGLMPPGEFITDEQFAAMQPASYGGTSP